MKKFTLLLLIITMIASYSLTAQVSIDTDGSPADASAMLDVKSDTSGILIPRMTQTQRDAISSPATGLMIFQTDKSPGFYYYNGASWEPVGNEALTIDDLEDGKAVGYSVYLGDGAGSSDAGNANRNVALGEGSLRNNVTGDNNLAVGHQALYNSTAHNNMAVGFRSMYINSSGRYNTATGCESIYFNTSGGYNTSLGYRSLYRNTTGAYNVGIGYYTNAYNQAGSNNTMIGHQAGRGGTTLHSKSGNVFIGYMAGYNDTTDNKLYIENSSSPNPLIYGDFDSDLLRVNGTLHIGATYHFPTADGTSGQVLTTDGSGAVGWATVATGGGPTSINDLTDAKTVGNSVFLGSDAGAGDDGSDNRNTALGIAALNGITTGNYNSGIGYRAGYYNTTGNYNIVLGGFADYRNQHGSQNTIIGYHAGTGGSYHSKTGNIHIGYQAGYNDTTDNKLYIENSASLTPLIWGDFDNDSVRINGDLVVTGSLSGIMGINDLSDGKAISSSVFLGEGAGSNDDGTNNKNTALGYHAQLNTTGDANISIGYRASESNTTGNYNVEIGSQANASNITGSKNTIIGYAAGFHFTPHSKSGNILIGYAAGYQDSTDNKLFIENSSSSSPLIYGEFDNDLVRINGDLNVTGSLDVTGSLSGIIGIDDLSNGKAGENSVYLGYLAGANSDGAHYNVATGDYALYTNTTGDGNTAIGNHALATNLTGQGNTGIGYYALFTNNDGANNSAIGSEALYSNTSGSENTASGYKALYTNTTGNYNTADGYYALYFNNGTDNTATGYKALYKNTTGVGNTASGSKALYANTIGDGNTASGYYALHCNTEGEYNVAIGDSALESNTVGHYNTGVGAGALFSSSSTWYNTAVGYYALHKNTNGSNTAIGYRALSKSTSADNNTGCGQQALEDNTTGSYNSAFGMLALHYNNTGSQNTAVGYSSGPDYGETDLTNTTALGYDVDISYTNYVQIGNSSVTWIGGNVGWSTYADSRYNNSIMEDVKGLDFIMKLRPVTYHFDKNKMDKLRGVSDDFEYPEKNDIEKIKRSGFLAQEVETAAQKAGYDFSGVKVPTKENTPYTLSYAEFVVPLVKAVQEQQIMIEEQKMIIEQMVKEIENLKNQ